MDQMSLFLDGSGCMHACCCKRTTFCIMKVRYVIFHNFLNNERIIIIFGVLETSEQVLWDSWKKVLTRTTSPSACLERRWKSDPKSGSRDQTFWWIMEFSYWNNTFPSIMILNFENSFYKVYCHLFSCETKNANRIPAVTLDSTRLSTSTVST